MDDDIITPGQLADELETGKWDKATEVLLTGEGSRCCLGVACALIGIPDEDIQGRHMPAAINVGTAGMDTYRARFPWMHVSLFDGSRPEETLSDTNDCSETWAPVIEKLREIDEELNS